jgi:hypothetical protein
MSLTDDMAGHVEWKKTYEVGWTKTPRKDGGCFYNVKQLSLVAEDQPVARAGNGKGEIDIRSVFGLMHSYTGAKPTVLQMLRDLRNAREALEHFHKGTSPETIGPSDFIETRDEIDDTF